MNYFVVLQNQLQGMVRAAVALLPSVVIAVIVLMVAWLVARFATTIVRKLVGHTHLRGDLRELLESLVKVAIWVVGILLAATIVIPGFTFGGMVAGLGIGAVAIGFAFQDIFKNFLAGVLIMLRKKMQIGDLIECEDIRGKVEHISLRETHVRQLSGELTVVPNSMLFEKPVQIVTDQPLRRDEAQLAIDFDNDPAEVIGLIDKAIRTVEAIDTTREPEVFVRDIDGTAGALVIQLRWWSDAKSRNILLTRSEVLAAVSRALAGAEISLPVSTTELVTSDNAAPEIEASVRPAAKSEERRR